MIYKFDFFFRLNRYGVKTQQYIIYAYRNREVNYTSTMYVRVYSDDHEYEMSSDTYPFYYDL